MDRAYLEDYARQEMEAATRFGARLAAGDVGPDEMYPPQARFPRLHAFATRAAQSGSPTLWPQLLSGGSLFLRVYPVPPEESSDFNLFRPHEAQDLVDLARATGRVQFLLHEDPRRYEGLEYLRPIFEDLRPPRDVFFPPNTPEHHRHILEFQTAAAGGFNEKFLEMFGHRDRDRFSLSTFPPTYAFLRHAGWHDLADDILDNLLIEDPLKTANRLVAADVLLLRAKRSHLHATSGLTAERLAEHQDALRVPTGARGASFPYEVGTFMLSALTHAPTDRQAYLDVSAAYAAQDVDRLAAALRSHIARSHVDQAVATSANLHEALATAWADGQRLVRARDRSALGLHFALGAVGYVAGGLPGLVGTAVADLVDRYAGGIHLPERAADRVVRTIAPPHTVAIYDFQRHYAHRLPKSPALGR